MKLEEEKNRYWNGMEQWQRHASMWNRYPIFYSHLYWKNAFDETNQSVKYMQIIQCLHNNIATAAKNKNSNLLLWMVDWECSILDSDTIDYASGWIKCMNGRTFCSWRTPDSDRISTDFYHYLPRFSFLFWQSWEFSIMLYRVIDWLWSRMGILFELKNKRKNTLTWQFQIKWNNNHVTRK